MSGEQIEITLRVNAQGKAEIVGMKKLTDELDKSTKELEKTTKDLTKTTKELEDQQQKTVRTTRTKTTETTKEVKAEKEKTTQKKKTTDATKEETKATEASERASKRQRDEMGKFVGDSKRTKRSIQELAESQENLSNAFARGFIKAQLFLGFLRRSFDVGLGLITGPIEGLIGSLETLIKRTVESTQKFDKFRITLEGALKSSERARQVTEFVQEFALKTPVKIEDIQDLTKSLALIPAIRPTFFGDFDKVKGNLTDLYNTVIGLSSLNPQQGIPGAVFAIREALTGQFRSLRARFDILPQIVAGSINKTVAEIKKSPDLVIKALTEFVNQSVGEETIRKLGELPKVRIDNILEALGDIAPRQIGQSGFQSFIQQILGQLDDGLQAFFGAGGPFETQFAPRISERLQGIVLQGLRVISAVLGGADEALGGAGAPTLERVAQIFENVLGKVEQTLGTFADALVAKKQNITSFFTSIFEGIEKGYNAVTGILEELPTVLPAIGGFIQSIQALAAAIINTISSVVKAIGSAGTSTLFNAFAPETAERLRTVQTSDTFAEFVTEGARTAFEQLPEATRGPFSDFLRDEIKLAAQELRAAGLGGRNTVEQFRFDSADREEQIRRQRLRRSLQGGIGGSAGPDTASALSQLAQQLAGGEGGTRGGSLLKSLSELGDQTALRVQAEASMTEAINTTDEALSRFAKRLETERSLNALPEGGATTFEIDRQKFERVKRVANPPNLVAAGLLGPNTEFRTPLGFEATRRGIDEVGRRVFSEFGGTINSIKDLGLQVQERLDKLLLDPLQKAEAEYIAAENAFAESVEKLEASVKGANDEVRERVKKAAGQALADFAQGKIDLALLGPAVKNILDSGSAAVSKISEERQRSLQQAGVFRGLANAGGFQTSIKTLSGVDLNDAKKVEEAFSAVERRLSSIQPILSETASTAFGELQGTVRPELEAIVQDLDDQQQALYNLSRTDLDAVTKAVGDFAGLNTVLEATNKLLADPLGLIGADTRARLKELSERAQEFTGALGAGGVEQLVALTLRSRTNDIGQSQAIAQQFGGGATPEQQLRNLEAQLRAVKDRSELEKRIRDIVESRSLTDTERKRFEEQLNDLVTRQAEQLELQISSRRLSIQLTEQEKEFQKELNKQADPTKRISIIDKYVKDLADTITVTKASLGDETGAAAAILMGIADPDKARAAAQGRIEALEAIIERTKELREQTELAAKGNEASTLVPGGGRDATSQQLFQQLQESGELDDTVKGAGGRLGTVFAGSFLDQYRLLTTGEDGKVALKSFGELFEEEAVTYGLKVADAFSSAFGDTVKAVLKGDLDSIGEIWQGFLDNILSAFADFVSQLIARAIFKQIFGSVLGLESGGTIGSLTALANGGVTGPLKFRAFGTGGLAGPSAGGPLLALIGEGSRNEGIVPLLSDDSIPATQKDGRLVAVLPGGRSIPISLMGFQSGGITNGPTAPAVHIPQQAPPTVIVINQLDSASIVADGLPANALVVENQVAGSIRNRGPVGKAARRYGR